ncbi:MAG: YraN family protein [Planktothrix agardhii]|jgi:putative endonuclease|uniref:YraN family protein n=1 Tax=Planktothrix rubescens TaxID=59512 RepID=UPI000405ECBA|nr:YraN family protein [Planktothrix rubescens]
MSKSKVIGSLGEKLVSHWLETQGWEILHHQWHCRYGEIDLIAVETGESGIKTLSFIEVKTRSQRNWDLGGLLAITPKKQAKIIQSAELFLSDRPQFLEYPCRFDVALVSCVPYPNRNPIPEEVSSFSPPINIGQSVLINGYQLILQDYIESAFSA